MVSQQPRLRGLIFIVKYAYAERSAVSVQPRAMTISHHDRATHKSEPGHRHSSEQSPIATNFWRASPNSPSVSRVVTCRDPNTGAAFDWFRLRSSSGRADPTGSTTVFGIREVAISGRSSDSPLSWLSQPGTSEKHWPERRREPACAGSTPVLPNPKTADSCRECAGVARAVHLRVWED